MVRKVSLKQSKRTTTTCMSCFWYDKTADDVNHTGFCRLNPPTAAPESDQAVFPIVSGYYDYCGHFRNAKDLQ